MYYKVDRIMKKKIGNLVFLLTLGLFFYLALSFLSKDAVFFYQDEVELVMSYVSKGKWIPFESRIRWFEGRFLPLQFFDYNIALLFSSEYAALVCRIWIFIKVLITLLLFYLVFKDASKFNNEKFKPYVASLCLLLIFACGDWTHILGSMTHSELTQGLFILLFVYFYQKAYYTGKTKYYALAFIPMFYSIFIKETMFVPYFVIGCSQLLFNRKTLTKKEKYFDILLILNGIMFVVSWYIFVGRKTVKIYGDFCRGEIFYERFYFLLLFLGLGVAYKFFFKKKKISFYDNLLLGGCAYMISIIAILKLSWVFYHYVPLVYLIIFLYSYLKKINIVHLLILYLLIPHRGFLFYFQERNKQEYTRKFNNYVKDKRIAIFVNGREENDFYRYCWNIEDIYICWAYNIFYEYNMNANLTFMHNVVYSTHSSIQKKIKNGEIDAVLIHDKYFHLLDKTNLLPIDSKVVSFLKLTLFEVKK